MRREVRVERRVSGVKIASERGQVRLVAVGSGISAQKSVIST